MKNRVYKTIVGALAGLMVFGCLTGCTPSDGKAVATIGDLEIPYGEANFYSRYMQSNYETYAGYMGYTEQDLWNMSMDGTNTLYNSVKDTLQNNLEEMYVLYQNMDAYDVTITEEEMAAIEAAADEFLGDNGEEVLEFMNASRENVVNVLKYATVRSKMYQKITEDVSTEVSDEEALQKKMLLISFPYQTSASTVNGAATSEEVAQIADALSGAMSAANEDEIKAQAEAFLKDAEGMTEEELHALAEEREITVSDRTFDAQSGYAAEGLCEEAFGLQVGQLTKLYKDETNGVYYAGMLVSEYDKDATDSKKDTIAQQRISDAYTAELEKLKEGMKIEWNDKIWDAIDFLKAGITDNGGVKDYSNEKYSEDASLTAADGDTVNIDYVGMVDGVAFDGGTAEKQALTLGTNTYVEGFEDQLIGCHPGDDVTVKVTFPEDYNNVSLAGQDAVFEVHVNGIYE